MPDTYPYMCSKCGKTTDYSARGSLCYDCSVEYDTDDDSLVSGKEQDAKKPVHIEQARYEALLTKEWCLDRLCEVLDGCGFIAAKINELAPKAETSSRFNALRYLQTVYDGLFAPKLEK